MTGHAFDVSGEARALSCLTGGKHSVAAENRGRTRRGPRKDRERLKDAGLINPAQP